MSKTTDLKDKELELCELARKYWLTRKDEAAEQYRTLLRWMIKQGWEGDLDVDMLLPDELMPSEYFKMQERVYGPIETSAFNSLG